jgi:hypothetical protein
MCNNVVDPHADYVLGRAFGYSATDHLHLAPAQPQVVTCDYAVTPHPDSVCVSIRTWVLAREWCLALVVRLDHLNAET